MGVQVEGATAAEVQEEMRQLADTYAALDMEELLSDPTCSVCGRSPHAAPLGAGSPRALDTPAARGRGSVTFSRTVSGA